MLEGRLYASARANVRDCIAVSGLCKAFFSFFRQILECFRPALVAKKPPHQKHGQQPHGRQKRQDDHDVQQHFNRVHHTPHDCTASAAHP